MSELRVAVITGNYNAVIDGVAIATNRQVEALLKSGAKVRVYAPVADRPLIVPHVGDLVPVPSIPIVPPYRLALGLPPSIKKDLAEFRPNLVHIATPDLLGFAAQEWARRRKIPVISTFHTHFGSYLTYYHCGFLNPVYTRAVRWFYRRCQKVFVACQSMIDELRRTGIDSNFIEMPFGVDTERFHLSKRSESWRAKRGFTPGEVVVLFVGRLVWEKGLQVFAETIHQLESRNVLHRVLIVGEGPAGEEFRKQLPNAQFAGRLMGDELPTAFASSDIFFFPSASETFGLVSLEALSSGLPAVVADATGSKDIIRNNVEGFVCPTGDVPAFASAVEKLIQKTSTRQSMSQAGVKRAQVFRWPVVMQRMVEAFQDAADLRGR